MAETNAELGRAVTEALSWLGASPETAGPLLGINARTLSAMAEGIVPMRSLVIRFAAAIGHHCERRDGAPEWWKDVDAWLRAAGYAPRRDPVPGDPSRVGHAAPAPSPARAHGAPSPGGLSSSPAVRSHPSHPSASDADEPRAGTFYHPVYERLTREDRFVHVFRILDREDRNAYQITMPAQQDYKARAAEVKRDLASLTREQFERKYARHRAGRQ
jgi:hypothetical protein